MPKYYCEYCDINLTHSSPAGRRQHNSGRRHINNKIEYYQQLIRSPDFVPPPHAETSRAGAAVHLGGPARYPMIMRPTINTRTRGPLLPDGHQGFVPPPAVPIPRQVMPPPALIPGVNTQHLGLQSNPTTSLPGQEWSGSSFSNGPPTVMGATASGLAQQQNLGHMRYDAIRPNVVIPPPRSGPI